MRRKRRRVEKAVSVVNSPTTLLSIPNDALCEVFTFLRFKFPLGISCRRLYELIQFHPGVWYQIYDFRFDLNLPTGVPFDDALLILGASKVNLSNLRTLHLFELPPLPTLSFPRYCPTNPTAEDQAKAINSLLWRRAEESSLNRVRISATALEVLLSKCPRLENLNLRFSGLTPLPTPDNFFASSLDSGLRQFFRLYSWDISTSDSVRFMLDCVEGLLRVTNSLSGENERDLTEIRSSVQSCTGRDSLLILLQKTSSILSPVIRRFYHLDSGFLSVLQSCNANSHLKSVRCDVGYGLEALIDYCSKSSIEIPFIQTSERLPWKFFSDPEFGPVRSAGRGGHWSGSSIGVDIGVSSSYRAPYRYHCRDTGRFQGILHCSLCRSIQRDVAVIPRWQAINEDAMEWMKRLCETCKRYYCEDCVSRYSDVFVECACVGYVRPSFLGQDPKGPSSTRKKCYRCFGVVRVQCEDCNRDICCDERTTTVCGCGKRLCKNCAVPCASCYGICDSESRISIVFCSECRDLNACDGCRLPICKKGRRECSFCDGWSCRSCMRRCLALRESSTEEGNDDDEDGEWGESFTPGCGRPVCVECSNAFAHCCAGDVVCQDCSALLSRCAGSCQALICERSDECSECLNCSVCKSLVCEDCACRSGSRVFCSPNCRRGSQQSRRRRRTSRK